MAKYLVEYIAPSWAQKLKHVPKYRVELATGPTPVHEWNLPGIPEEFKVGIKRHDMTGSTLTGNKKPSDVGCNSNLLFNRLSGAHMYIVPKPDNEMKEMYPKMEALADRIMKEKGEKSYLIPKGASNTLGLFGSMAVFEQLSKQGLLDQYDDIILPCGSSGTAAGLCIANHLSGSPFRIHGVLVNRDKDYVHGHINQQLVDFDINGVRSEDILDVIDEYRKDESSTKQSQLEYIVEVCTNTGMVLDPTYTGKAAWGMVQEMKHNPGRFKGRRVLFIHTGGMFGLFEGSMDTMLMKPGAVTNNITMWCDVINNT